MNILQVLFDVWNALNGKKTEIASGIALVTTMLSGMETTFGFHQPFIDSAISILTQIALYLGGVGLIHKVVKKADGSVATTTQ